MTSPLDVRVSGPLTAWRAGFCEELDRRGYARLSVANQVRVLAHVSRWMAENGVELGALTSARCDEFLVARRVAGYSSFLTARGLAPLLGFLRAGGVVPEAVAVVVEGPLEEVLVVYRAFLVEERSLAAATVARYGDSEVVSVGVWLVGAWTPKWGWSLLRGCILLC